MFQTALGSRVQLLAESLRERRWTAAQLAREAAWAVRVINELVVSEREKEREKERERERERESVCVCV